MKRSSAATFEDNAAAPNADTIPASEEDLRRVYGQKDPKLLQESQLQETQETEVAMDNDDTQPMDAPRQADEDIVDISDSPMPCFPEVEGCDSMMEIIESLNRAQTVLVAMQTTCPQSRHCAKVVSDIEALLIDVTLLLSTDMEDDEVDIDAMKQKMVATLLWFRQVKEIFDDIVKEMPKRDLRRHPTDDGNDDQIEGTVEEQEESQLQ